MDLRSRRNSARAAGGTLRVLLALLAVASRAAAADSRDSLPGLIKRAAPGVVTVITYDPNAAMPRIGTGFFVAADRVVTARHVLAGVNRATVRTSAGSNIPIAGILAEERASDLVMVQLQRPAEGVSSLPVSADAPDAGERLFTLSSPLGLEFSASDGIVSAYRDVPGAGVSMQHTVAVSPGSSGCPLINDRGEVVAVQTGSITAGQRIVSAGQGLNFAVSAKLLGRLKPGKLRTLGESVADLPRDWRPPITEGIDAISLHPLSRDDFRGAAEFFRRAVAEQPDEPDLWFRIGLCHEKLGETDKAVEGYRKAIALKPDLANAHNNLGACQTKSGRFDDAIAALNEAVRIKPDFAEAYLNLAVACVEAKKWKQAVAAAANAVRLNPADAESHLNLGVASAHLGDGAELRRRHKMLLGLDVARAKRLESLTDADAKSPKGTAP